MTMFDDCLYIFDMDEVIDFTEKRSARNSLTVHKYIMAKSRPVR